MVQGGKVIRHCVEVVADYIFPRFCFLCKQEGNVMCDACLSRVPCEGIFFYPEHESLARVTALSAYREGDILSRLIHALKYEYVEDVARHLACCMQQFANAHANIFRGIDMIMPVPLHRRRFAERGFNQAELVGYEFSRIVQIPLVLGLLRKKYTLQQAKLGREERIYNVHDAFRVVNDVDVAGRSILLVDDVYTTGSTLSECASALRAAGAARVEGFVLAKGE